MSSSAATSHPPTSGLTSRERVERALAHQETDRVPLDLGGSLVTGMHVSSVYKLRQALGLDPPGHAGQGDRASTRCSARSSRTCRRPRCRIAGVTRLTNAYGFRNEDWKEWSAFDGIPMLVPGPFPTEREPNGDILMYSVRR